MSDTVTTLVEQEQFDEQFLDSFEGRPEDLVWYQDNEGTLYVTESQFTPETVGIARITEDGLKTDIVDADEMEEDVSTYERVWAQSERQVQD